MQHISASFVRRSTIGADMNNVFQCRIWSWVSWLGGLLFWGGPLWSVYFYVSHFHVFNEHPFAYVNLVLLLVAIFVLPYSMGNLVTEIRREGSNLVFQSFGRLPLVPYGPTSTEVRVSAGSAFEWRRPLLIAKNQGGFDLHFKLATRVNKRRLADWFEQNGISKPYGC